MLCSVLFPRLKKEVESLKDTICVHEQLTRPFLQRPSDHFDFDLRRRKRSGPGKEEPPRLTVLEGLEDEAMTLVPRDVQPWKVSVHGDAGVPRIFDGL